MTGKKNRMIVSLVVFCLLAGCQKNNQEIVDVPFPGPEWTETANISEKPVAEVEEITEPAMQIMEEPSEIIAISSTEADAESTIEIDKKTDSIELPDDIWD